MENDRSKGSKLLRVRLFAVVAAVLVVGAGAGLSLWYLTRSGTSKPTSIVADGPTFYQALGAVNGSVASSPGGPWTIFAVWGVASPVPFDPNALGWLSQNLTVNSCGEAFNGVTLWNGTIPLFNGTFDSGTAPFWQFAFFSNASQSILIATDLVGVSHVFTPMAMTSVCAKATGLGGSPWAWAKILSPFPADSSIMAESAWSSTGQSWESSNRPGYELFVLGWNEWGSANPEGLIVKFARCGEVGFTGIQPVTDFLLTSGGTVFSVFNGSQGCGNVMSLGPPPVYVQYVMDFSNTSSLEGSGQTLWNQSFQVAIGSPPVDSDAGGLVSWMLGLNLTTNSGERLSSVSSGCPSWVPSLADCGSNESGWYAVLLSPSGGWLDSFPAASNGTLWTSSTTSLVSNQILILVAPSTWNLTGDTLSATASLWLGGAPVVSGSTVL